jgi:hypothetical protein
MAKRTRSPGRPSGRRPGANRVARSTAAPRPTREIQTARPISNLAPEADLEEELPTGAPAVARSAGLTEAEIERAAELEAEATARQRAAIAETVRLRTRGRAIDSHASRDVNAPLSVRAAHEYAYVARDVRRILLTGGLVVGILIVLDVLVNVMGVVQL